MVESHEQICVRAEVVTGIHHTEVKPHVNPVLRSMREMENHQQAIQEIGFRSLQEMENHQQAIQENHQQAIQEIGFRSMWEMENRQQVIQEIGFRQRPRLLLQTTKCTQKAQILSIKADTVS